MKGKLIAINKDMYSNIKSMSDFYKSVGIVDMIPEGYTFDVQKIYMNKDDCEELQDIIYNNLIKDEQYKNYKEKYLRRNIAMDWLFYSPSSVKKVASGFLLLEDDCMVSKDGANE